MKKNILIGFLLITVVTLGVLSYTGSKANANLKNTVTNNYDKSLNSLIESFEQLNSRLSKISVSNDDKFIKKELLNLYGLNLSINENINNIPINHSAVINASQFLNKTTNYYYSLITSDENLSNKNKKDINKIYESSSIIYKNLDEMNSEIRYGNVGYNWIENENVFMSDKYTKIDSTFKATNEEINEYPTLIFDGPFSDSINPNEKVIIDKNKITKQEGAKLVENIINNEAKVKYSGEMNGNMECYVYNYNLSDVEYSAYVSKNGGKLITINSSYDSDENANRAINIKQAVKLGKNYMHKLGIENMEENYYETDGNIITINYAYSDDGITFYPDLIKVKISLTNKNIVGFEATNYYTNHKKRNVNKNILKEKEILNKVNEDFNVKNVKLAVIPTETNKEKLCYEVKGKKGKDIFIIYINAYNGNEENILKVIEADDSILTI